MHDYKCSCVNCKKKDLRRRSEILQLQVQQINIGNTPRRVLLNGLREGDKIIVYSGGNVINGTGIFLRIENEFLIWVDSLMNINNTNLESINIQRVS